VVPDGLPPPPPPPQATVNRQAAVQIAANWTIRVKLDGIRIFVPLKFALHQRKLSKELLIAE
jgi:hypothetical protein